jgi:hypothetical protein
MFVNSILLAASLRRHGATLLYLARNPALPLLYFLAKANMSRFCAAILRACMQRISVNQVARAKETRILALSKSVFIEDAISIMKRIDNVELILLGRTHLHFVAKAFFKKGTNDNNYHDMADERVINQYREFLTRLWVHLNVNMDIRCVLTGNFGYFEERELAFVLEAVGVPFVAVHKECLKTPGRINELEDLYRSNKGPFWGSRILVYNDIERDLIVRTSVAHADRVIVVGMPRLDEMHRARTALLGEVAKKVLLISFHKDLNAVKIYGAEAPSLDAIWESVHLAMYELAERRPEVQITIKTKGNKRDIAWIADLALRHKLNPNLPNLRVVHGGRVRDMLIEAKVVCGAHSTALLEALAANKPVIVTEYEELADSANKKHLIDFGGAAIRAISKASFMAHLNTQLDAPPNGADLTAEARALLKFWLGNDDGYASERAAREIMDLIGKVRHKDSRANTLS